MVVSAISTFSGRYSYVVLDVEHEEIKKKLSSLGLIATGSKIVDKARLEEAQKEKELEESQKAASEQTKATTEEVQTPSITDKISEDNNLAYILRELGVHQTNDIEIDYRNAVNALRTLFMSETNMSELSHLRKLKFDLDKIMAGYGYSTTSIASSEMTGATAIAEMNKVLMLKGGNFSSSGK